MQTRLFVNWRRGFTLVELLVVIAIISILAALLLPALEGAIKNARIVSCASNLKQNGTAHALYQNDFGGFFPLFGGKTYEYTSGGRRYFRNDAGLNYFYIFGSRKGSTLEETEINYAVRTYCDGYLECDWRAFDGSLSYWAGSSPPEHCVHSNSVKNSYDHRSIMYCPLVDWRKVFWGQQCKIDISQKHKYNHSGYVGYSYVAGRKYARSDVPDRGHDTITRRRDPAELLMVDVLHRKNDGVGYVFNPHRSDLYLPGKRENAHHLSADGSVVALPFSSAVTISTEGGSKTTWAVTERAGETNALAVGAGNYFRTERE